MARTKKQEQHEQELLGKTKKGQPQEPKPVGTPLAPETESSAGNAPAPGTRQRRERRMTAAEWDKVHNACVRAERHPDPAQTAAFDLDALTVRVGSDET